MVSGFDEHGRKSGLPPRESGRLTTAAPSRARVGLSALALSLASILAVLLAAEVVLRALGMAPERFARTARLLGADARAALDCYPTNPRGYFDIDLRDPASRARYLRLAPHRYDTVARRAPWAVETRYNALRFREASFAPKRPGVRRVMVVGDSFTEGQGVKQDDTFVRALDRIFAAKAPGRWEVLNCGRRGADFPALYEAFEEVLPFDPDVVVYAMVLNDAVQSPEFHARQTYLNDWIQDGVRMAQTSGEDPEPGLWSPRLFAFVRDRVVSARVGRESTRWYLEMYGEPNRDGWERTKSLIRDMDRRMHERGGRFLLALWPLLVDLEGAYPFAPVHETIHRFCAASGISDHDLRVALRGGATSMLWVHPVDRHPNEIAHRRAAESLAPVLQRMVGAE